MHTLLQDLDIERVETVEIESAMAEASRGFMPRNSGAFADPRGAIVIDDAKSFFAAGRRRYDIIVSEPSNPWVAGVSGLFTTEFYAHVKRFMAPHGVFAQWIHLSEINDGLVLSVVRAIAENFPDYAMYSVGNHDVLIVATADATLPAPDWSVLERPGIAHDLKRVLTLTPQMLDALRLVQASTLAPLVQNGGANSDFYPVLDLGAERTRYLSEGANGFTGLSGDRFGLATLVEGRRASVSTAPYIVIGEVARLEAMELAARVSRGTFAGATPAELTLAENVRAVDRLLATDAPPVDWHVWVGAVRQAEETRAGGTAGIADTAFYSRATRFTVRENAPPEARAAIAFLHGLAAWDFSQASSAADTLLEAARRGDFWLPADLLREGAVVAKLRIGDVNGAHGAFIQLHSVSSRSPNDVRPQLLAAWIAAAAQPVVEASRR
jgi:hypothetical protein